MYVISYLLGNILVYRKWQIPFLVIFAIVITYKYTSYINIFQLNMTITHFPYFLLGYYIGFGSLKISLSHIQAFLIMAIALCAWMLEYRLPKYTIHVTRYITAYAFIISLLHFSQYVSSTGKILMIIKRNSMGIYLWHVIILYIAYYHYLFAGMSIFVQICLMSILSLVLSILMTYIIRCLHLSFILGESK